MILHFCVMDACWWFFGTRREKIEIPVWTDQIPREIPTRKYPSWLFVLGVGTLSFGTLFIELLFILSSICLGRFYYLFTAAGCPLEGFL
jgi:transmembrane 9 superfamily member 2/4